MKLAEPAGMVFRLHRMARPFRIVIAIALVLCACVPETVTPAPTQSILAADTPPPVISPNVTGPPIPLTKLIATLATPHIEPGPDGLRTSAPTSSMGCAYRWAYQDLPELSNDFQTALQELQPGAKGYVFAFGEDCIHDDGTVTFLPMETDFNSTLPVSDLSDEAELGDWIIRVMQVIENIPPEQIRGPRPGRVSLLFESGTDRAGVNFYIDQYRALPADLTSAEIFRMLQESQ